MDKKILDRAYLETLSFTDLLALADRYGIDVPDNLNRSFLIGDLLDVAEETKNSSSDQNMVISADSSPDEQDSLPDSYNTTEIEVILRNPAWAFVYWNLSETDMHAIKKAGPNALLLRVCPLDTADSMKSPDSFDVQISASDSEQYILLQGGKPFVRIDLVFVSHGTSDVIASSRIIEIPHGSPLLQDMQPGRDKGISPVMELSGMKMLLADHYKNHRQSFS